MMKLYSFVNMYLSDIQKGIQTAHLVSAMAIADNEYNDWYEWEQFDKTIVVLRGGNCKRLDNIQEIFKHSKFTWASVYEPDLNNALVCVGIILPEYMYNLEVRNKQFGKLNPIQKEICNLIDNGVLV